MFAQYTDNVIYQNNYQQWDVIHDCLTNAIKRKGKQYLMSNELPASAVNGNPALSQLNEYIKYTYTTRVLPMAVFYDFTSSSLNSWVGIVMNKDPLIELADEGQESLIDYLLWNADGAGKGIIGLGSDGLYGHLAYGAGGYIVIPPESSMSQASIRDGSIATRIWCFDRRHILDWRYDYINSERKLTYLKLLDGKLQRDGVNDEDQVLCIEYMLEGGLCWYSVQQQDANNPVDNPEYIPLIKDGKQATSIPCHVFGNLDIAGSTLTTIANLNIEHYQMSSRDQQQRYDAGMSQKHIDLGDLEKYGSLTVDDQGNSVDPIKALNPAGLIANSMVPMVTANGGTVSDMAATTDNLLAQASEMIEKRAVKMGAVMMEEQSNETATAARIANSGIMSQLVRSIDSVSKAMQRAIEECGEYNGYAYDGIKYQLSRDLVDPVYDAQSKQADLQMVEMGKLPLSQYFAKLKRMGEIEESMTFEDYKAEIEEERNERELGMLPTQDTFGSEPEEEVIAE